MNNEFPLHCSVIENDTEDLRKNLLKTPKDELDIRDLRGKTPLELAIFLNRFECAKLLVEHGADCGVITKAGWNLVQESVSTGNPDLIKLIISYRDFQRESARTTGIPELLKKLKQAPDFYVEMKWEFTSWIPLISKACPSDVYKVYKSGRNVRIDTTLIGFNGSSWERGNRSYIFQTDTKGTTSIIEIDHLLKTYFIDKVTANDPIESATDLNDLYEPEDTVIHTKLSSPNIVTFLDIEKIEFERNRSGIWGWRSDKNETINGYDCKVFTANNLQLVTKTRVEHMNNERANAFLRELEEKEFLDRNEQSNGNIPNFLTNYFQGNEQHIKIEKADRQLTAHEYFQKQVSLDYYLNGMVRKIDETRKIQTFNANLSLSDSYPLSLHEQVLPIVDLMALNNSHFKKLKEFITLQLPSGFPVKIEIPLYRVITAKVTFGNIHAIDQHVDHVTTLKLDSLRSSRELSPPAENLIELEDTDSDTKLLLRDDTISAKPSLVTLAAPSKCVVDESVFKIPSGYRCTNRYYSGLESNFLADNTNPAAKQTHLQPRYNQTQIDEDDIMLQIAIQQSLSYGQETDSENLENALPNLEMNSELTGISTAILPVRDSRGSTQSLQEYQNRRNNLVYTQNDEDMQLQRALEESLLLSSMPQAAASVGLNVASASVSTPGATDDPIMKALEWSRREAEERRIREQQEEDEFQKILALSLIEK